jgi:hypothetical protein
VLLMAAACGGEKSSSQDVPLSPSPTPPAGGGGSVTLTAPAPDAPANDAQLTTLRPTLTVRNTTSSQPSGTRVYEFQISDRSDFTVAAQSFGFYYAVVLTRTGVPEDPSGKTSFTPDTDLQPATKLYWRSRVSQGTVTSDWSASSSFRTKIAGYNRPGELYDPLVGGETVGERVGATSFVPNKGLRLDSATSFVRYRLPATVTVGEFSMEVEGLQPNIPVIPGMVNKPKIFGMQDGDGDYTTNDWRIDGQYRGLEGNPPNCIQFRAMFGGEQFKIEPDTAVRYSMVFLLDPARTYFWRGSWNNGFRLEVRDGMAGHKFYDQQIPVGNGYNPPRHVAYLGAPRGSGGEMSVIVGATYRNVWLSSKPRPTSLGSALDIDQ